MIGFDFPFNTNQQALDAGLVLLEDPKVDVDEIGLRETTLEFITAIKNYPRLGPARGTSLDQFRTGDDETARILRRLNYLGAQKHSASEKLGINQRLSVFCQGAIFDILDGVYPEYDPAGFSSTQGDDIVSPHRGSEFKTGTVTFKFRANDDLTGRVLNVGTTLDNSDIADVRLSATELSTTVSGIPIDGRKIYVRNIMESPKFYGGSKIEEYIYDTAVTPAVNTSPDALSDELTGKPFGAITTPLFDPSSTQQSVTIPVVKYKNAAFTYLGQDIPASDYELDVVLEYHALDLHYEYMAEKRSRRPRFLQSSYEWDPATNIVDVLDGAGGKEQLEILIDKATVLQQGNASFVNPDADTYRRLTNPLNSWQEVSVLVGTGAHFSQPPAGRYFHVLETAQIQIAPALG